MITRKKLKFQLGGVIPNIIPDFKKLEYKSQNPMALIQISDKLQTIYDTRLKEKQASVDFLDNLELSPYYSEDQKRKAQDFRSKLDALGNQYNNDITNPGYAKGLLDLTSELKNDTEIRTARYNTSAMAEYQKEVSDLTIKNLYNRDFDPNAQHFENISKGIDKYRPFVYRQITAAYDYNAYLAKYVKDNITADQSVLVSSVSSWDLLTSKITGLKDDKVLKALQTAKDSFLITGEGQAFKIAIAKKHNLAIDENTGKPIESAEFKKKVDDEYLAHIQRLSTDLSYSQTTSLDNVTIQGALTMDKTAEMNAANEKAQKEANKQAEEAAKTGLFTDKANAGFGTLPDYILESPGQSFDYKSSFNKVYTEYDAEYNKLKSTYGNYTFTGADGKAIDMDKVIEQMENTGSLTLLTIKNNGSNIADQERKALEQSILNVSYKRNLVKAESQYINEFDRDVKNKLLSMKDNNNILMYRHDNSSKTINLGGNQLISYTTIQNVNDSSDVLFLITDPSKGYKEKIVTDNEFITMYPQVANEIRNEYPSINNRYEEMEKQIIERIRQAELNYAKSKGVSVTSSDQIPYETLIAFRSSESYKDLVQSIKGDVYNSSLTGAERNYLQTRLEIMSSQAQKYTVESDQYIKLNMNPASISQEHNRHLDLASQALANLDQQVYMINGGDPNGSMKLTTLRDAKSQVGNISTNYFFNNKEISFEPQILGYDMNDRIGGVWIGQFGITLKQINGLYSGEGGSRDRQEFISRLQELVTERKVTYDSQNEVYYLNNTQLILPDANVSHEFFKNVYGDGQSANQQYAYSYNKMMSTFNNGNSIYVEPIGKNTYASVRFNNNNLNPYNFSYTDAAGIVKSEDFPTVAEATRALDTYKQLMTTATESIQSNPYVNVQRGNIPPNMLLPVTNLVNNVFLTYLGGIQNDKTYKETIKQSPQLGKLNLKVENNAIKIDLSNNSNYGGKSLLNVLRQIAHVEEVDDYGNPVFSTYYNNLDLKDRSDLSDNPNMSSKQLNLNNPAQLAMIRRIFGTDNISFTYPDNNPNNAQEIIITFN